MNNKLIISIYDLTEAWSGPYIRAGYPVICWDYVKEGCILRHLDRLISHIQDAVDVGYTPHGILSATPCTAFAGSGAQHWPKKDAPNPDFFPFESFTEFHIGLAQVILHLRDLFSPIWWVQENPVGRLESLMPEFKPFRKMSFNPCDYGDPYTKKTILWGEFNSLLPQTPVLPILGSMMHKIPPGPNRAALRSATPRGFAEAFFKANP